MHYCFNHNNNSIAIPYTLNELKTIAGMQEINNGLNFQFPLGKHDKKFLDYRHEFAHFVSMNASGLIDFQGILSDHKLYLCVCFLRQYLNTNQGEEIVVPIREGSYTSQNDLHKRLLAGLNQVREIEAFMFGYGTKKTMDTLFDWNIQQAFFDHCDSQLQASIHPNLQRIRQLFKHVIFSTDPDVFKHPELFVPSIELMVNNNKKQMRLSSRGIIEAYAIAAEAYTRYKIKENGKDPITLPRSPARIDRITLEVLQDWLCVSYSMDDFLEGNCNELDYWDVLCICFASMSIPIVVDQYQELTLFGSLKQLNPAHRFSHIMESIETGKAKLPRFYFRSGRELNSLNAAFHHWFANCCDSIGDKRTAKINKHFARNILDKDEFSQESRIADWFESSAEISFASRAMSSSHGHTLICDTTSDMPLSPKYILCADGELVHRYKEATTQEVLGVYYADSGGDILESIVDEYSWETIWDKIYYKGISAKSAKQLVINVVLNTYVYPYQESKLNNIKILES